MPTTSYGLEQTLAVLISPVIIVVIGEVTQVVTMADTDSQVCRMKTGQTVIMTKHVMLRTAISIVLKMIKKHRYFS